MLELSAGDLSLGLVPEAGGAIAWLTAGELDVLRRGDPTIDPTAAACFPLVPYSGPVVGGRFRYEGGEHRLEHNHPNEPEPIHGEGWVVPWELVAFTSTTATLRYRHVATARHISLRLRGGAAVRTRRGRADDRGVGHEPGRPADARRDRRASLLRAPARAAARAGCDRHVVTLSSRWHRSGGPAGTGEVGTSPAGARLVIWSSTIRSSAGAAGRGWTGRNGG